MIELSEVFGMIGVNGCSDVATSMQMQGTDACISIPIFEVFYFKILPGDKTSFLAENIPEYNALRMLATNCGAVCAAINLLDMDILSLLGAVCVYTPNTGMNVFIKDNIPHLVDLTEELVEEIVNLAGIPFEYNNLGLELAAQAIDLLFEKLMERLGENMERCGIQLRQWGELPEFYNLVKNSGEMNMMREFRKQVGGAIF